MEVVAVVDDPSLENDQDCLDPALVPTNLKWTCCYLGVFALEVVVDDGREEEEPRSGRAEVPSFRREELAAASDDA